MLIAVVLLCSHAHSDSKSKWPEIKELNVTYPLLTERSIGFDLPITNADGRTLYELKCHRADYEGDPDFDYSGLIDCRFISTYSKNKFNTLFAENKRQDSDWENRGRFLVEHLLPGCASYPEWGATRQFQLRGITVVLKISNIKFADLSKNSTVDTFDLSVTVKNTPNIQSVRTQAPETEEPHWFYHPSDGECQRKALNN